MPVLEPMGEGEFEVWADDRLAPPYLFLVVWREGADPFKILDPQKNNEEVLIADNYLQILDYLKEEEYFRINGRMDLGDWSDDVEEDDDDDD